MSTSNDGVLIVGSGFAGLGLGIRLQQAKIEDFTILEQADDVGGTWRDNHYPGAACDVQSHLYCFSFEPNPSWSRQFAPQREILDYLRRCADKYGIRDHIRFRTEVTSARFDEATNEWEVTTNRGSRRARVLVLATGGLSRPAYPDIEGRDAFRGKTFHSARWDHQWSLEGKRVGVIGTGASAIQIVPAIAPRVQRLTVFQRTPPWIFPKPDAEIPEERRARFRRWPLTQRLTRLSLYWANEARLLALAKRPALMKHAERAAVRYLEACVDDPELRRKLIPSYTMGCKRILLSNDYYQALARPNVDLVTESIARIQPDGISTEDGGHHRLDAIVYATGFQTGDAGAPFEVMGPGAVSLDSQWEHGAEAFRGAAVAGFPNLFVIAGPNTGLSHSSMVLMLESLFNYVVDAVQTMRARDLVRVSVRPDVFARYNEALQARFDGTVWASGCKSWYLNKDGKNVAIWPGFTFEFRRQTRRFDLESYDVEPRLPEEVAPPLAAE